MGRVVRKLAGATRHINLMSPLFPAGLRENRLFPAATHARHGRVGGGGRVTGKGYGARESFSISLISFAADPRK